MQSQWRLPPTLRSTISEPTPQLSQPLYPHVNQSLDARDPENGHALGHGT